METLEIKLYSIEELSEEAKQRALDNIVAPTDFCWDDAEDTIKAFNEAFNVRSGRDSWLEYDLGSWDDSILELRGLRLRTWIINNWGSVLWKARYRKSIEDKSKEHRYIRKKRFDNGKIYSAWYSQINKDETCCVLTGMCYDDNMLKPIYDFIAYKDPKKMKHVDIDDLISDCFHAIKKTVESEIEYYDTEEAKIEHAEANDYKFLESGKLWNI